MSRRYLRIDEIECSFKRGKSVECFLGGFTKNGSPGIRRLSVDYVNGLVLVSIYETADYGDGDLYEFGPLNPDLELDEADETFAFDTLSAAINFIEVRYPGASSKIVNELMLVEEYGDYLKNRAL